MLVSIDMCDLVFCWHTPDLTSPDMIGYTVYYMAGA